MCAADRPKQVDQNREHSDRRERVSQERNRIVMRREMRCHDAGSNYGGCQKSRSDAF